jgi:hypothetical protein
VRARLACGVRQVLIQWKGEPAASATWEDLDSFRDKPRGRAAPRGGRDVMWGCSYSRKWRARDVCCAAEHAASSEPSASSQAVSISG